LRPVPPRANANAPPVSPAFRARLPAIAKRECASNSKQLQRCLPPSLLRAAAISWPLHFLLSRQPISFPTLGFCRIEFRSLWRDRRDVARVRAQCGVYRALPSISAVLRELLFLFAIRL